MNRVARLRNTATMGRTAVLAVGSLNLVPDVPAMAAGRLDGQVPGGCAPMGNSTVTHGAASACQPKETIREKEGHRDED
jgi:hypothetical protein